MTIESTTSLPSLSSSVYPTLNGIRDSFSPFNKNVELDVGEVILNSIESGDGFTSTLIIASASISSLFSRPVRSGV